VTAIAAGEGHTVALKNNGTVVAWGYNGFGQTNVPAGLTNVTAIAAGYEHTVALKSDGTVVAWGRNIEGEMTVPAGLTNVTAIAAGYYHTVALKSDGTVVAWGAGKTSTGSNPEFGQSIVPAGLSGVTAIAAGGDHTVAIVGVGPTVTALSTGNNLTLLWPATATGYRVQSALSLSPPITWSNVTGSFQTNGGSISIVLPFTGAQKFYRLVKP
jgi:alpha-tubulin suppressor-like RCC1 family protein